MGNESGEIRALRSGAYQSFPFYVALLKGKDFELHPKSWT